MSIKKNDFVMTKEEIRLAAKQLRIVEKEYPELYKMHVMIVQLHTELTRGFSGWVNKTFMKKK